MGTDLQSAATPPIVAASPKCADASLHISVCDCATHTVSDQLGTIGTPRIEPGTEYKPEALPLSYVPQMAGGGFEPPVSRLWALRDNHFSTLQAAARSRTRKLLITGQLLYQLSYDGITDKCRLAPIFIVLCAALSGHCFYVFSLYQQYP